MNLRKIKVKLARLVAKKYSRRIQSGASFFPRWDYSTRNTAQCMVLRRLECREKKADKIENIIIGPCYGRFDWITGENDINLSWGGEDLRASYYLLNKNMEHFPNLRNIVQFYGTFSPGLDHEYTMLFRVSVLEKVLFSVPYRNEDLAMELGFCDYEKFYASQIFKLKKEILKLDPSYVPFERGYVPTEEDAKAVALGHYKNHQREIQQTYWLEKNLKLAQQAGKNIYVVIPPYKLQYRRHLPPPDELFAHLFEYEKQYPNLKVLNFFHSELDEETDFMDYEHLNRCGAEKLTAILKKEMAAG